MGAGPPQGCAGCSTVFSNPINAHDLAYDPERGRLYASTSALADENPNSIWIIDSSTLQTVSAISIGADPNVLALSEDASTLWVGIDGGAAMRKLTLTGAVPTAGPLRTLPRGGPSNEPTQIGGMQAIPGSADSVIAALRGVPSQVRVGTYVLDDGTPRTAVLAAPSPASFALGPPGIIFGSADGLDGLDSAIYTMTLSSGGLSTVTTTGFLGGGIRRDGGLLFSSSGEVIDVSSPASPFKAGQLPIPIQSLNTSIAVLGGRRLLVVQSDWHGQLGTGSITLSVFETSGFKKIASGFLLFKFPPLVSEVFYLGGDALVALAGSTVVLIHAPFLLPP